MREFLRPRFREYAELVLGKRKLLNLTAAETLDEIYDRHIEDGLAALPWLKRRFPVPSPLPLAGEGVGERAGQSLSLADIGAGAGFVGIALKLAWPEITLTLVESRERRAEFLEWVTAKLGLVGVKVLRKRAEDLAPHPVLSHRRGEKVASLKGRGNMGMDFDVVIERALAPLAESIRVCMPLVGPAGVFLAYQSAEAPLDDRASEALERAHGRRVDSIRYNLPGESRERAILCFERTV